MASGYIQPPGFFRHSAGAPLKNRVAVSTFDRYLERVYSHPVFRHSAGVPLKNRVAVSPFHRYLERVYSHPVFHTSPSIYTETYVWLHSRLVPGCSVLLEEGGGRTLGLFSRRVLCTSLGVAPAGSKHSRGQSGGWCSKTASGY